MKDNGKSISNVMAGTNLSLNENVTLKKKWAIRRYDDNSSYLNDEPYSVTEFEGNVLLNQGINVLQKLLTNSGSQPAAYSNASASIGVGNDATAAAANQTGLLGASASYATMSAGYPVVSGQTTTWRAVFGSGSANFDWREFTVSNSASNAGDNLNRKVSNQGTKAAGQTWTIDLDITWS